MKRGVWKDIAVFTVWAQQETPPQPFLSTASLAKMIPPNIRLLQPPTKNPTRRAINTILVQCVYWYAEIEYHISCVNFGLLLLPFLRIESKQKSAVALNTIWCRHISRLLLATFYSWVRFSCSNGFSWEEQRENWTYALIMIRRAAFLSLSRNQSIR